MGNMDEVLDWLAGGALSGPNSEDVLAQLCERLAEAGLPLWRVAVFVSTLHPDVMGRSFRWEAESGVTVSTALHSLWRPRITKKARWWPFIRRGA